MKRFFCLLLVLVLLPLVALAEEEYTPALNMTMDDFIAKYNSIGAPFNSPLVGLTKPTQWTMYLMKYAVAWFPADKDSKITILLLSKDPSAKRGDTSCGLDIVQIFMKGTEHFLPFVSVSTRCASLFTADVFGTSMAPLYVCDLMKYFYENSLLQNNQSAIRSVDVDAGYILKFFYTASEYYFQIYAENNDI